MPGPTTDAEHGEAVLTEAVVACKDAVGDRLLAAYALGSLAHGGFSALVSDVDLGLALADPIQQSDSLRSAMRSDLAEGFEQWRARING